MNKLFCLVFFINVVRTLVVKKVLCFPHSVFVSAGIFQCKMHIKYEIYGITSWDHEPGHDLVRFVACRYKSTYIEGGGT